MRRVRYSVAMSLDGYISGPKGEIDWIVIDPEMDFGALMGAFDTVLLGRRTWEMSRGHGSGGMPGMRAYVCSRTLGPDDIGDATLVRDPATTIGELKQAPGKDIWLFGGGTLFRSVLDLGLVDAVEVAVIPVLLGGGVPLLPPGGSRVTLSLTRHRIYPTTGTASLEYVPMAGKATRRKR
jgi:dihydrofolate reductase